MIDDELESMNEMNRDFNDVARFFLCLFIIFLLLLSGLVFVVVKLLQYWGVF